MNQGSCASRIKQCTNLNVAAETKWMKYVVVNGQGLFWGAVVKQELVTPVEQGFPKSLDCWVKNCLKKFHMPLDFSVFIIVEQPEEV